MSRYRVKVECYVVVDARNATDARARAEVALRQAVQRSYLGDESGRNFADGWELFGWNARKAERVEEDVLVDAL